MPQRAVGVSRCGWLHRGPILSVVCTPSCWIRILPHQTRKIDARYCVRRGLPRSGYRPIAAIVKVCRRIPDAFRLRLRQLDRRFDRIDEACAHAAVIAQPIDVNPVVRRVCFYLKEDCLAAIDTDIVSETLNRRIALTVNVPLRRGAAPQLILLNDSVPGFPPRSPGSRLIAPP